MKILQYILLLMILIMVVCILYVNLLSPSNKKWACSVTYEDCGVIELSNLKRKAYNNALKNCATFCKKDCKIYFCDKI